MLKVAPLGGLGEIGLNTMAFEHAGERMLVDCGLMFPHGDLPGVEIMVPDFSWLFDAPEQLKGIVLTHAHEDHIGAVPWLLKNLKVPVYGTRFTLGLLRHKLQEQSLQGDLREISPRERFKVGSEFTCEAMRVTHSVPDGVAVAIETKSGTAVHTGDFKLDLQPIDGRLTDLTRLGELGEKGIDLLLSDSTNSEFDGPTPSEQLVADTFAKIFAQTPGRIIVTIFGSHLFRVQALARLAEKHGRKMILAGRSLERNVRIAGEVGLFTLGEDRLVPWEAASQLKPGEQLIVCTGAQAEPRSALNNMLSPNANLLKVEPGDTVILSSRTIPGNEPLVTTMIDRLLARGAKVIYPRLEPGVHVSGHASRAEQRQMIAAVQPRHFVPIHGELHHLHAHRSLALEAGLAPDRAFLLTNGDMLGLDGGRAHSVGSIPVGRILTARDSDGQVTPEALQERRALTEGIAIVLVVLDASSHTLLHGPQVTGKGLATAEAAVLSLAAEASKTALLELSRALWSDDEKVKEVLAGTTRSTIKRLTGSRPPVVPLVVRL